MKTPQSIFNKVWRYFVRDGHPKAVGENGDCLYRGLKSRCAVGCQLPNRIYKKSMETKTLSSLFQNYPVVRDYFGAENQPLLSELQEAHDSYFSTIRSQLKHVASRYGLTIPKE